MMTSVFDDRRTKILAYELDVPRCTAAGLVCGLWGYAESIESDGLLSHSHANEMLAHVGWKHPGGASILDAIEKSGWLTPANDQLDKGFRLADWEQIQSDRLKERLRKRNQRALQASPGRDPPDETGPTDKADAPRPVPAEPTETPDPSHQREEGGKGVDGISENGAQRGFLYGPEEAKPPKKRTKPITADQVQIPPEMDRPGVVSALEEWLVYKRKRGQAYKDPAYVTKLLSQFIDDPPGVFEASVDYTIGQHWSGLFRPGNRPTPRDTTQTRRPLAANAWDQAEKELSP